MVSLEVIERLAAGDAELGLQDDWRRKPTGRRLAF
jgi:hypothetical protein